MTPAAQPCVPSWKSSLCPSVCTCGTAEEALEVLPQQKPDVVLMDIQLPSLSGIECAARLKQLLPEVKIIMVTVYGNPVRIFNALRCFSTPLTTVKRWRPVRRRCGRRLRLEPMAFLRMCITRSMATLNTWRPPINGFAWNSST